MSAAPTFTDLARAARTAAPEAALVLGSGMGTVADGLRREAAIPFGAVPGLTDTSIVGHRGRIALGEWAGRRVLVFEGRLHFYEGHPWERVVLPVQTAHALGARVLLLTNAAGGIHDALAPGSLMLVRDHLDWTRPYAWRLPGPGGLGPPRPSPYAPRLIELLAEAGRALGSPLHRGVYGAVTGPSYETPAEIRALRACGADAVGMSTAREALAGYEAGMACAAVSCITNRAAGLSDGRLDHQEVLATAAAQRDRLAALLEGFLRRL
ncbi:MAG: purine-nucleoside phosphorylase [Gemmataceae bacterium]|nr:purine-nucleoside phosphorylase [Gemmataceae bacterium]